MTLNHGSRHHEIAAGVLVRDGTVLLCHRSPSRAWYPNVWDLPGGHIEPGEAPLNALIRELREELGIDVDASDAVGLGTGSPAPDLTIQIWAIGRWAGEVANAAPTEHDQIGWFSIDELGSVNFPDDVQAACRRALTLFGSSISDRTKDG